MIGILLDSISPSWALLICHWSISVLVFVIPPVVRLYHQRASIVWASYPHWRYCTNRHRKTRRFYGVPFVRSSAWKSITSVHPIENTISFLSHHRRIYAIHFVTGGSDLQRCCWLLNWAITANPPAEFIWHRIARNPRQPRALIAHIIRLVPAIPFLSAVLSFPDM